jgi:tRNA-2-methylthio-N6-dimethylallyladenosine synthase
MAETHNVMPQLHMPLQSGSDRILASMKRSYRQSRYLDIVSDVRKRIPDAAISTDIIVGFPGESDEDFEETLKVVKEARFSVAYTYTYSKRPGTAAAVMPDQVPKTVIDERYMRLVELINQIAWEENQSKVGSSVEVLIADGEGKKDSESDRLSGRARDNRLVHVNVEGRDVMPGDLVSAVVTYAAPYHLLADTFISHRRPDARKGIRTASGLVQIASQGLL